MAARHLTLYPETIAPVMPILCNFKSGTVLYRVLFHIGKTGLSTRPDIARAMGLGLSSRKARDSSFRRISRACETLSQLGFIEEIKTDKLFRIKRFYLITLSDAGKEYCLSEFPHWGGLVQSDWEKLITYHKGAEQEAHSAMILNFAYHARLRGWETVVMPRNTADNTDPDVQITKNGENYYIEVERQSCRTEQKPRKWKNQFKAQNRIIACYSLKVSAFRAAASFVGMGYTKFYLTSLEYLQKTAYDQPDGHSCRLWQYTSEEFLNG